jgi:hypothetical protein
MNASVAASGMPMYLELAAPSSSLVADGAGALLRDYLAIVAFYLAKSGAGHSDASVNQAIGNLPGLLLGSRTQGSEQYDLSSRTAGTVADALASLLGVVWGIGSAASVLSPVTGPIAAALDAGSHSVDAAIVVLQRPAVHPPTLGCTSLAAKLQRRPATPTSPAQCVLSVSWARTTSMAVDAQLSSSQQFAAQLRRQGLLADLGTTPGYLQIITP